MKLRMIYRTLPLISYEIKTGITMSYDTVSHASKITGFKNSQIGESCRGILKSYKGYFWFYQKEYNLDTLKNRMKEKPRLGKRSNLQVVSVCIKTKKVKEYESQHEAGKYGFNSCKIGQVCKKQYLSHLNHYWFYKKDYNPTSVLNIEMQYKTPGKKKTIVIEKPCSKCLVVKPLEQYGKTKEGICGRHSICKVCKLSYVNLRRQTDPMFKLSKNLRCRLTHALRSRNWAKNSKYKSYIGCDQKTLFSHLENKFEKGMSWDNYSLYGWHVDHIIPLCSAKTPDEMIKLCHYTNLQPLWREDNLKKGNRII